MLWSLGAPISFAGFVLSFFLALVVRTIAVRATQRALGVHFRPPAVGFNPRHDIDVFGVVAMLIGAMGWGKGLDVDELPPRFGRGRRVAVYAAGPLSVLLLSQLVLLVFALGFPGDRQYLLGASPASVVSGLFISAQGGNPVAEFIAAVGVGLFAFALFDLIPLPPLDGWGILWCSLRNPSSAAQTARLWLVEKNLGVVILFVIQLFPYGGGMAWVLLHVIGSPLLRPWAW
ncbi:M50 family metallopeptidase [Catenuloplanes japonicus]|uniref:M50 family metallopeptidase n=1 Tax=Catenuloplanes japonicus TaxID=33876 RepID=UPI000526E4E1|nr:M50 family metallopeptidase [Catenuloplanes japonicus]